jgi:hypothetical protein
VSSRITRWREFRSPVRGEIFVENIRNEIPSPLGATSWEDAAPTELILLMAMFYKDVAPTALEKIATLKLHFHRVQTHRVAKPKTR